MRGRETRRGRVYSLRRSEYSTLRERQAGHIQEIAFLVLSLAFVAFCAWLLWKEVAG